MCVWNLRALSLSSPLFVYVVQEQFGTKNTTLRNSMRDGQILTDSISYSDCLQTIRLIIGEECKLRFLYGNTFNFPQ